MIWGMPWAWALAAGVLLPVLAHLWSRRQPHARPFPTLRFLRAVSPISRRLHRLQDWPLFLLRAAIVLMAAAAAAGPTLITPARLHAWRARVHRVIVLDARAGAAATGTVSRLQREVASARVVGPGEPAALLIEAAGEAAPRATAGQTEVVVIWDGSRARLSPADLSVVPAGVGLRLLPVAGAPAAEPRFAEPGGHGLPVDVQAAPADAAVRARLIAALGEQHVPWPGAPLRVLWPGTPAHAAGARAPAVSPGWMQSALQQVAADARVRDAAARSERDPRTLATHRVRTHAQRLASGADGDPLLWGWIHDGALVLALHAAPSSPLSLWAVIAASDALSRPTQWSASLPGGQWSQEALRNTTRAPASPPRAALPAGLDTRWAWTAVLALLLVEQWWRRPRPARVAEGIRDAA